MKINLLRTLLVALALSYANTLPADEYYFFIQFTDKNNSPYSLSEPEQYLSERALQRRSIFGIAPDSTDLPVNPAYIQQIQLQGVNLHSTSKWLNGITVLTADSTLIHPLRQLKFVKQVQYTGLRTTINLQSPYKTSVEYDAEDYGASLAQINQLKGTKLHQRGADGRGVLIAVLDAGFKNVDTNPGFDSLRVNNRLAGSVSVVDPSIDVFREDQHGALVLSAMVGNIPGKYLGTAPAASYYLVQTEYAPTEYLVETDFWVRGAELADSIGADIINSSLGYTEFDDPAMNFSYADMNGRVARSSIAAEMAAQKGIIVCNSAGNSGNLSWRYLSSPADARSILSVGSVDIAGNTSSFSSYGPASDGRIKPEVAATGTRTALLSTSGTVIYSNGTSFSSPLVAGMAACYLQLTKEQNKESSVHQLIENILKTAHLSTSPDPQLGYGIPDFSKLPELISGTTTKVGSKPFSIFTNHTSGEVIITLTPELVKVNLRLFDSTGRLQYSVDNSEGSILIPGEKTVPGVYIVQITMANHTFTEKILIL